MSGSFRDAVTGVTGLDAGAMAEAARLQDRLTKPRGALGRLEALGEQLAGIAGQCPPPLPVPAAVAVFAGDHGVLAEGVSPWPQEVTAQMVANLIAGGAAINVLARQANAGVTVVDVGVATDLPAFGLERPSASALRRRRIRNGTANLAVGPAMSEDEAAAALDVGADIAAELAADGARCLVTGEMGIGNTTAASALIAALTGRPAEAVTGRGTGIDDRTLAWKTSVVKAALARHEGAVERGPLATVAAVGGLEIAALAGFIVGGAAARLPVIVDGVVADAGLLLAAAFEPAVVPFCVAGHRSVEPGARVVLEHLGLEPVLDLGMRLGEGTGACLAAGVLEASARILREMATFDSAGVTEK